MPTPPTSTPWVPMYPLAATVPAPVEGKWLKTQGGAMVWSDLPASTSTKQYPLKLTAPRSLTLAGNAFWTVQSLTNYDLPHWEFVKDVEGRVTGQILIPKTVAAVPNAKVVLLIAANAVAGVTRLSVAGRRMAADGALLNDTLIAEASQDVTVYGVAYQMKRVTFPLTNIGAPTADQLLILEIIHEGAHANDTLAVNTLLVEAYLEIDS